MLDVAVPGTDRLEVVLGAFLDEQRYRGNSEKTVGWYKKVFNLLAETGVVRLEQLTRASLVSFILGARARDLSTATLRNYDRALRCGINWMHQSGYLTTNPIQGLPKPKGEVRPVEPFQLSEIARILEKAKTSGTPLRDTALILLLLDTGIRAGEVCNLTLRDIYWNEGLLRVHGKTGERKVPFGRRSRRALTRYLSEERKAPHPSVEAAFLSGGHVFTPEKLNTLVTRLVRRCNITRAKVGPHTFRHTFATEFLRAGGNVFVLQRILGHRSLEVTRGYVALLTEDVRDAHQRFSPVDRLF